MAYAGNSTARVAAAEERCRSCGGTGLVPTGHVGDTTYCVTCNGTGTDALIRLDEAARALSDLGSYARGQMTPEAVLDRYDEAYRAVRDAFARFEREVVKLAMKDLNAREPTVVELGGDRRAPGSAMRAPDASIAPEPETGLSAAQAAIRAECDRVKEILLEKNKAYGNSALDPVRVFSKAPADEQIRVRLDDKISRLTRGEAAGEDVVLDMIGYLVLLRVAQRQGAR